MERGSWDLLLAALGADCIRAHPLSCFRVVFFVVENSVRVFHWFALPGETGV